MPWTKMPGIEGRVYEPEQQKACERKHDCRDCFYCQMCSDVKCAACRKEKSSSTCTCRNITIGNLCSPVKRETP